VANVIAASCTDGYLHSTCPLCSQQSEPGYGNGVSPVARTGLLGKEPEIAWASRGEAAWRRGYRWRVNANDAAMVAAVAAAISALTAFVSVSALVFSTWLQWRAGRARVNLEGAIHTLVSSTSGMGTPMFGIDVRNVGVIPVVVTSVGVVFRNGELGTLAFVRTLLGEQVLPKRLDAGEAVSLAHELQPVVDSHHEKGIRAVWARTAAGQTYRGKTTAKLSTFEPSSTTQAEAG
jgi:hypothetical protein